MCEPTDVTLHMEINTETLRSDKYNIPDLPNTKDYHLFICYTESDSTSVREIVNYLEAQGLKCCYNERDFQSGRKIIHSINDAIKRSMGIIIILSEESVKSNFCQHEIDLAVHTSITEGYTIIPIKIQPCVIPEALQEITYIDAQYKESSELYILILNAFLQNVWHVEQERTNGLTRSISLTKYLKEFIKRLSVWRYKLLVSQNERQSIRMKGFNVTDARFDEIQTIVNSSLHVKYKHIYKRLPLITVLLFSIISFFIMSMIYLFVVVAFGNEMDSTRAQTTSDVLFNSMFATILTFVSIEGLFLLVRFMTRRGCTYESVVKVKRNSKLITMLLLRFQTGCLLYILIFGYIV